MELEKWQKVALISLVAVGAAIGLAGMVLIPYLLISWLIALLNMPG
jgi:hypothetical protein